MPPETVTAVELPRSTLRAVEARAKRAGQSVSEFIRFLIERDLLAEKSFDEILRPVREDIERSGITPDELDAIVERAKQRHRAEKKH